MNLNGPEQTGSRPKSAPASDVALGDIIMPERSANWASSVASGWARVILTVNSSTASAPVIEATSDLRRLSSRFWQRSMLATTASALKGVPSWKVDALAQSHGEFGAVIGHSQPVASCGMISSSGVMSTSLSQSEA